MIVETEATSTGRQRNLPPPSAGTQLLRGMENALDALRGMLCDSRPGVRLAAAKLMIESATSYIEMLHRIRNR
jgi:hypothetical protein